MGRDPDVVLFRGRRCLERTGAWGTRTRPPWPPDPLLLVLAYAGFVSLGLPDTVLGVALAAPARRVPAKPGGDGPTARRRHVRLSRWQGPTLDVIVMLLEPRD